MLNKKLFISLLCAICLLLASCNTPPAEASVSEGPDVLQSELQESESQIPEPEPLEPLVKVEMMGDPEDGFDVEGVFPFHNGFAKAVFGLKYGLIDKTGEIVLPFEYQDIGGFDDDGFAYFNKDGKYGVINNKLEVVVQPEYDLIYDFSEGLAAAWKDGKCGFIDPAGNVAVPLKYDVAQSFSDGLALVIRADKYGFVDKTGKLVINTEYDGALDFSEGLACVQKNEKFGFIDITGELIVPLEYDGALSFSNGLARVMNDGKYGFIDKTGNMAIPLRDSFMYSFKEEFAFVGKDNKYGLMDKTGNFIVEPVYDWVEDFVDGYAYVYQGNTMGIIDKTGNIVLPVGIYDYAFVTDEYISVVNNEELAACLDLTSKEEAIPFGRYHLIGSFNDGVACAAGMNRWIYIDKNGTNVFAERAFTEICEFSEGFAWAKDGSVWYILKIVY